MIVDHEVDLSQALPVQWSAAGTGTLELRFSHFPCDATVMQYIFIFFY